MELTTERSETDKKNSARNVNFLGTDSQFNCLKRILVLAVIAILFASCANNNALLQRGPVDRVEDAVELYFLAKEVKGAVSKASYQPQFYSENCSYRGYSEAGPDFTIPQNQFVRRKVRGQIRGNEGVRVVLTRISGIGCPETIRGTISANEKVAITEDGVSSTN